MEQIPLLKKHLKNSYREAGFLNRLFYWYGYHIVRRGQSGHLDADEVEPNLDENDATILGDELEKTLKLDRVQRSKRPLITALRIIFGWRFFLLTVNGYWRDGLWRIIQYFLLGRFIRSFRPGSNLEELVLYGIFLLLALFVTGPLVQISINSSNYLSLKMRIAVTAVIYRKSLRLSHRALGRTGGVGKITNLVVNDAAAFQLGILFAPQLIGGTVTVLSIAGVIWSYVGISCLLGLVVSLGFVPVQFYASKKFAHLRIAMAASTDRRLRLVNEVLNGILLIKMSCWETCFSKLVGEARAVELKLLSQKFLLNGSINSMGQLTPKLSLFTTLIIYVFQGNNLDAETGFLVLTLFNGVAPFGSFLIPYGIVYGSELWQSLGRIQEFLREEEYSYGSSEVTASPHVTLVSVTTKWEGQAEDGLRNINMELTPGKFICVIGPVGSGKSTLLHTILHETEITSGKLEVQGSVAFTAQTPCIFPGTIEENILFGTPFNLTWYEAVVEACALERDFELLPFRDKSMVGEKGVTLSGGQKARISLARAVYRNADIYLLDDPLSSVDVTTGRHIYDHCIRGLLRSKCVILVTHLTRYATEADEVFVLEKGSVLASGSAAVVTSQGHLKTEVLDVVDDLVVEEQVKEKFPDKKGPPKGTPLTGIDSKLTGTVGMGFLWKYLTVGNPVSLVLFMMSLYVVNQSLSSASDIYLGYWINKEEGLAAGQILPERETYVKVYSIMMAPILFFPFLCVAANFWACLRTIKQLHKILFQAVISAPMQFFETTPTGWVLNRFSKDMTAADQLIPQILLAFTRLTFQGIAVLVVVSLQSPILIIPSIILMFAVVRLRRFYLQGSSAISRLETTSCLWLSLFGKFVQSVGCPYKNLTLQGFAALVVVCLQGPILIIPSIVVLTAVIRLRQFYLRGASTISRLESATKSPVVSRLTVSMHGLSTIRAFRMERQFASIFDQCQNNHSAVCFSQYAVKAWFSVAVAALTAIYLGSLVIYFTAIRCDASVVGLAMASAMNIRGTLSFLLQQSADLENRLVAVDRILEYSKLPAEGHRVMKFGRQSLPDKWPRDGRIDFSHVSAEYVEGQPVLSDITCSILPREKVGIVGRTGAGKTTLVSSIFRIMELTSGKIHIDGIDISKLSIFNLRSRLSIIPQDPILFKGTLRKNLDPLGEYDDLHMFKALEGAMLTRRISEDGLESDVAENGSNFSQGERQLISFARAMLKNPKILVMDESTAHLDSRSDEMIQSLVKTKFNDATVITIAHRLQTVLNSNRICVMDGGKILEFDSPERLLQDKQSQFSQLMRRGRRSQPEAFI